MATDGTASNTKPDYEGGVVVGSFMAVTLLFGLTLWSWPGPGTAGVRPDDPAADRVPFYWSSAGWALGTLAVAIVICALIAVLAWDARRVPRDNPPGERHRFAQWMGVGASVIGGLFNLVLIVHAQSEPCTGTGFGSFECANRPGGFLLALGWLSTVAAPLAGFRLLSAPRSRLSAWLAPVLIFGLYLLALRLWQPHVGLGAHFPPPPP
jgi:hypothetical protein